MSCGTAWAALEVLTTDHWSAPSSAFLTVTLYALPHDCIHRLLSSHRFLYLPSPLPPCPVPFGNVSAKYEDFVLCQDHWGLFYFAIIKSSVWGYWELAQGFDKALLRNCLGILGACSSKGFDKALLRNILQAYFSYKCDKHFLCKKPMQPFLYVFTITVLMTPLLSLAYS